MIGIVNYGSGNIHAIANIYKLLGIPFFISGDHSELNRATHLILPGVGAFDETMRILINSGLKNFLDDIVEHKAKPVLGICVGMQLLAEGSEEGNMQGFGWIKGFVKKFDKEKIQNKPYLPHLGWNTVEMKRRHSIFDNINQNKGFYFLHSYYFDAMDSNDVLATTTYGIEYASSVNSGNIYGMQFHPEKSHQNGIEIFKNFSKLKIC